MKSVLRTGVTVSLMLMVALFCFTAVADQSGRDGDITWTLSDDGVLTISGSGEITSKIVEDNKKSIINVVIKDGVTSIGDDAFYYCSGLTSVTIPDSVTSIGNFAFSNCDSLTGVTIPDSVKTIGSNPFRECSSLTTIEVSTNHPSLSSVQGILYSKDGTRFICCPSGLAQSMTSVTIQDGVRSIDDYAFSGCNSLTSVTIPDSVTSIGNLAFFMCGRLTGLTIPDSVTSIGRAAFNWCFSLTSVTIPDGVASIGDFAFSGCRSLTDVTIPDSVMIIGDKAFFDCRSLVGVTIPDGVTSIGESAFAGCSCLTEVMIPDSVMSIGDNAFSRCDNLTIYCFEYSDADFWAEENGFPVFYLDGVNPDDIRVVDLPDSVSMTVGERVTLTPVIFPTFDDPDVQWSSLSPETVGVDGGELTAVAPGHAVITLTVGNVTRTVMVDVLSPDGQGGALREIWMLAKTDVTLSLTIPVAEGADVEWKVGDDRTAVINSDGGECLVSGRRPGDTVITAEKNGEAIESWTVHVCYPVTEIKLAQSALNLTEGDIYQLVARVAMRDQECENALVTFASADESIATVDQYGIIHALKAGTTTVTVAADSGVSAECQINVYE